MRIVLDTNVLISGTFWKGDSAKILQLIDIGKIELILSEELIEEYREVINRDEILDKIQDKNLICDKSVQKIIQNSTIVEPLTRFNILIEDLDDIPVLECAFEGKSDFIITNDNHLLKIKNFHGIGIITPKEFLEKFSF